MTSRVVVARSDRRLAGTAALAGLCLVYVALATFPATTTSDLLMDDATGRGDGWPNWLVGPLRFAGIDGAGGPSAGPLFLAGLYLALLLYTVVLIRARDISARAAIGAVAGVHGLVVLGPPLLIGDAFYYIAYARLDAVHDLNPYVHSPADIPQDEIFRFVRGGREVTEFSSPYGPVFALLTKPLASLGVPTAFWILKVAAGLASLGLVAVVWKTAKLLGRDPVLPALFVGLNPHVITGVSNARNDLLLMLVAMLGVLAFVAGRQRAGAAIATLSAGIKVTGALVGPFLAAGARRKVAALAAALAALATVFLIWLIGFGAAGIDGNLETTSSSARRVGGYTLANKTAAALARVLPGDFFDYRHPVLFVYTVAFAGIALWLLVRTWGGADPIAMAAWATLALLLAGGVLTPWYLIWLLPLAALAWDWRLVVATLVLSAWTAPFALPL